MSDEMRHKGAVPMRHVPMPNVAPKAHSPASDAGDNYAPTTVRPEDEAAYQADLATWRAMCIRWGNASDVTWRDEQNFKRAWTVQQDRIRAAQPATADRETIAPDRIALAVWLYENSDVSTPIIDEATETSRPRPWGWLDDESHAYYLAKADRLLASGVIVPANKIRAEQAEADAALILKAAPPLNAELSMQGGAGPFEDRGMAAYIEGIHDAYSTVLARAAELRGNA